MRLRIAAACCGAMVVTATMALADDVVTNVPKEGMPPVIPHAVSDTAKGASACLSCHAKGKGGAPKTTHLERVMCLQCHVATTYKRK